MQGRWFTVWVLAASSLVVGGASAQDPKPEEKKKEPPVLLLSTPIGVEAGAVVKVALRGLRLADVAEVVCGVEGATAKVLEKKGSAPPNQQDAKVAGDSQLTLELTLPAEPPADGLLSLVVKTADGESQPFLLPVTKGLPIVAEKEPNGGFAQAQLVAVGQAVEGTIPNGQDVDVFRYEGQAGERVAFEVLAARRGSVVDGVLSLYNSAGQLLSTNDDHSGADPLLDSVLPAAGVYYLSLQDAHDRGGPAHPYRLLIHRP